MACNGIGATANPFVLLTLWLVVTIAFAIEREFWSFKKGQSFYECDPNHLYKQAGWIKMWLLQVIILCTIFFVTALNWRASPGKDGVQRLRTGISSIIMMLLAIAAASLEKIFCDFLRPKGAKNRKKSQKIMKF